MLAPRPAGGLADPQRFEGVRGGAEVLGLATPERRQFLAGLAKARAAEPLEFEDIFSRGQLEPVRLRHAKGKQAAAREKREILDAVFAPLK